MASNPNNNFPSWSESGSSPPNGFSYDAGDQVNEKHLDFLWNELNSLAGDIEAKWNAVDANEDDVVSDAENVTATYKGNDIDSDGDGKVDSADSADSATDATNVTSTYKGNDIDSDGDGKVDSAVSADSATDATNVTATYKGNDIDSDGDGKVDNADQLDGNDASAFLQKESWYFTFVGGEGGAFNAIEAAKAHHVDFDLMETTNQTFDASGSSGSGNTATCRLRDETNGSTVAQVSTTSTSDVRLTDTTWSNPTGSVTLVVDFQAGTDNFIGKSVSASSSR